MVDVFCVGSGSWVLAQGGEIAGHLAIEERDLLQFLASHLPETAGVGLREQSGEPVPLRTALMEPGIGKNGRHEFEYRSA